MDRVVYEDEQDTRVGLAAGPFATTDNMRANKVRQATPADVSTIQLITQKLEMIAAQANAELCETSFVLEQHADRLLGVLPQTPNSAIGRGEDAPALYFGGQLGELQRAVDGLQNLLAQNCVRLREAAGRNTSLA